MSVQHYCSEMVPLSPEFQKQHGFSLENIQNHIRVLLLQCDETDFNGVTRQV